MSRQKSPSQNRRPNVGITIAQGLAFIEQVRHGIVDYARARGGWTFSFMPEMIGPSLEWFRHMRLDGAFALVLTPQDLRIAQTLRFPCVNLAGHIDPSAIPSVMVDHRRIGQMAAEHLLGLGFARLGYYGTGNMWYSRQRHAGFMDAAAQAGAECHSLIVQLLRHPSTVWRDQHRQLERWLRSLRLPAGIMASIDLRASMIVDVCMQIGLRVPDDVAVLGVDNNQAVCELGAVPLTSVARNDWKVGWEAAAMLDRLMAGESLSQNLVFIEPERVVTRKSTETMPVNDPFLSKLIAGARDELNKPFGVEWLVQRSKRSRRWLERRFLKTLGQPPHMILNRLRVAKARELLASAEHDEALLSDIAARCGFADLRRFRLVFSKHTGSTPRQFRDAVRKTVNGRATRMP